MLVLFFFGTEQEDLLKLKKKEEKTRISIDPLCPTHADI
jgi:hypothetical protein